MTLRELFKEEISDIKFKLPLNQATALTVLLDDGKTTLCSNPVEFKELTDIEIIKVIVDSLKKYNSTNEDRKIDFDNSTVEISPNGLFKNEICIYLKFVNNKTLEELLDEGHTLKEIQKIIKNNNQIK